jgi:hypothetical protein
MNVEIGTEAAQIPEKDYINGIFLAVRTKLTKHCKLGVLFFLTLFELKIRNKIVRKKWRRLSPPPDSAARLLVSGDGPGNKAAGSSRHS